MLVRVEHVDLIDDITLGVAEGVELFTERLIRFVGDRGDLNGLALALEAGRRPVFEVRDPLSVIAIDGVYPHLVGSEVRLPDVACSHAVDSDCPHYD